MQKWILAVSPDTAILEQISAHLQEGGRFLVICASSGKEALTAAGGQSFDLAILDAEIDDLPFVPLARELTALIPSLKLFVYPPNNNPKHPALNGLVANGYLNKPFFGPEVSEKIIRLFKESPSDQPVNLKPEVSLPQLWVDHPDEGAKQIEQLLGATSASAGMLLLRGQVIAGSGALADETATNVVNFLTRYWTNIQSGELFRYLKMNHETTTYLVYAAPLFKNVAIALVYHPNASLQDIRSEVLRLRKGFLGHYTNTGELRHDFSLKVPMPTRPFGTSVIQPTEKRIRTRPIVGENLTEPVPEQEEIGEGLSEKDLNNLDALLADMPEPDPTAMTPTTKPLHDASYVVKPSDFDESEMQNLESSLNDFEQQEIQETEINVPAQDQDQSIEQPVEPVTRSKAKTAPLPHLPENQAIDSPQQFLNFDFKLPWEEMPLQEPGAAASLTDVSQEQTELTAVPPPLPMSDLPAASQSIDIKPPPLGVESQLLKSEPPAFEAEVLSSGDEFSSTNVEPVVEESQPEIELPPGFEPLLAIGEDYESINPSELLFRYNFILVPRNPGQFITHDVSELINQSMPQFHAANNWEFIGISTRPLYLQWSAALPLSVCLKEMVTEIRQLINNKIFITYPDLLHTHPNADFWASGFFAISGAHSPSNRLIHDYISLSRQVVPPATPF